MNFNTNLEQVMAQRELDEAAAMGLTVVELRAKQATDRVSRDLRKQEQDVVSQLTEAGVPLRTIEAATGPIIATDAIKQCLRDDSIIVLAGEPGRGKSVAACAWLIAGYGSVRWVSAGSLSRGVAYDEEAFQRLSRVCRLVIDDAGTEYQDQKDRYLATFCELLDARFGNKRATLITTNLTPEDFKARYGERLASRLNEDGVFIVCGGRDLRREKEVSP